MPDDGLPQSTGDRELMKPIGRALIGPSNRLPIGIVPQGRRIAERPENGPDRPLGKRKIEAILPEARLTLLLAGRPEETLTELERRASGSSRFMQSAVAENERKDPKLVSGPGTWKELKYPTTMLCSSKR